MDEMQKVSYKLNVIREKLKLLREKERNLKRIWRSIKGESPVNVLEKKK